MNKDKDKPIFGFSHTYYDGDFIEFQIHKLWIGGELLMGFLFCLLLYPLMVLCIAATTNDKNDPRRN